MWMPRLSTPKSIFGLRTVIADLKRSRFFHLGRPDLSRVEQSPFTALVEYQLRNVYSMTNCIITASYLLCVEDVSALGYVS